MWKLDLMREDEKVAKDIFEKAFTATINTSSYQFESNAQDTTLHLLKTRL